MAQKVQLVDDIDGNAAAETVSFSLDGAAYEIDLSDKNAKKLRDALAHWVSAGRRVRPTRTGARPVHQSSANPSEIRAWAKGRGLTVNDRGRIPSELVAQYLEQH